MEFKVMKTSVNGVVEIANIETIEDLKALRDRLNAESRLERVDLVVDFDTGVILFRDYWMGI